MTRKTLETKATAGAEADAQAPAPKTGKAGKAKAAPANPQRPARKATRARQPKTSAPDATPSAASGPRGKLGIVVAMLRSTQGATIAQLMEATGWQAHSVRGALAGAVKKKLGLTVTSEKTDAGRVYRVEAGDDAA
jgi:hypothetical protein